MFDLKPLWSDTLFEIVSEKTNNSVIYMHVRQLCQKWHPVKFSQLVNFDVPPFWPGMS